MRTIPHLVILMALTFALSNFHDVSRQTTNAIETGKFDPSLPLAFRVARLFGLRIEEVLQDEDRSFRTRT